MGIWANIRNIVRVRSPGNIATSVVTLPGVGTGAAYAANDALGTQGSIAVPKSGVIETAILYDLDDEGSQVDILLFNAPPAEETDNGAISISNGDLRNLVDVLEFTAFVDLIDNRVSILRDRGVAYVAPEGRLWFQAMTRSVPNIAAANTPQFKLIIRPDAHEEG